MRWSQIEKRPMTWVPFFVTRRALKDGQRPIWVYSVGVTQGLALLWVAELLPELVFQIPEVYQRRLLE
jgi:hypothetical protein